MKHKLPCWGLTHVSWRRTIMASGWAIHPWEMTSDTRVYGCKILRQDPENPGEPVIYIWQVHDLYSGPYKDDPNEDPVWVRGSYHRYVHTDPERTLAPTDYGAWVQNGRKMTWDDQPILADGEAYTIEECQTRCRAVLKALGDDV